MSAPILRPYQFAAIARCCVCCRSINGEPDASWGGESAHRACAQRAFEASRRPPVELTDEQRDAVTAIELAIKSGETFALHGLAGTGKTTVAAHIAASRPGAYLCALSNKAASVLSAKANVVATTVHQAFYHFEREIEEEGRDPRLVFRRAHLPGSLKGKVLLLDECSMIDRQTAADILETGITVVAIGDPGQLPPVNGTPFFTRASFELKQIHRQALESPIIRQAHSIRQSGSYAADGNAVRVLDRPTADDLCAADVVLVGRRATRGRLNTLCRRARGIDAPLPREGEPIVCLRNMRRHGVYNGAIYSSSRNWREDDRTVGIVTEDGEIEVPAEFMPPGHEYDRPDLPPWMGAFAFGYALTVHVAQGSEFDNVLLIDEWPGTDRIPWLYTSVTRAAKGLTIVRQP
jgi:exodeoxyribonuclease-5